MKRYENLDGLRAIACMGIAATHLYAVAGYTWGWAGTVISSWTIMVILFMMLSGFGICAGYLEKMQQGKISLEQFYSRRYAKILPFFLVTTLSGVAADHSLRGIAEGLMELSLVFGLLPNNSNSFNVNGICWTLGTIFAFYLLFPFVSVLLKTKKRAWMALAASVVIQFLCITLFMTDLFVVENYACRTNVLYCMTFFIAGGLLYLYRADIERFVRENANRKWVVLAVCAALTIGYYLTPHHAFGMEIADQKVTIVFAAWCIYAIGCRSIVLNNRVVRLVAKYSMEIYLSHMIVLRGLQAFKVTEIMEKNALSFAVMFILLMVLTIVFVAAVNAGTGWITKRAKNMLGKKAADCTL